MLTRTPQAHKRRKTHHRSQTQKGRKKRKRKAKKKKLKRKEKKSKAAVKAEWPNWRASGSWTAST